MGPRWSGGPPPPPAPPTRSSGACPLSVFPRGGKAGGEGAHEGRPYEMGGAARRVLQGPPEGERGMSGLLRPFEPDAELAVGPRWSGALPTLPLRRALGARALFQFSPKGGKAGGEGAHEGRPYEMGGAARRVLEGPPEGERGMSGLLRPFEPDAELAVGPRWSGALPTLPLRRALRARALFQFPPEGERSEGRVPTRGAPTRWEARRGGFCKGLQRGKGG